MAKLKTEADTEGSQERQFVEDLAHVIVLADALWDAIGKAQKWNNEAHNQWGEEVYVRRQMAHVREAIQIANIMGYDMPGASRRMAARLQVGITQIEE